MVPSTTKDDQESVEEYKGRVLGTDERWSEDWLRYCFERLNLQLRLAVSSNPVLQSCPTVKAISLPFDDPVIFKQVFGVQESVFFIEDLFCDGNINQEKAIEVAVTYGTRPLISHVRLTSDPVAMAKALFPEIDERNCSLEVLLLKQKENVSRRLLQLYFEYPVFVLPLWCFQNRFLIHPVFVDALIGAIPGLLVLCIGGGMGLAFFWTTAGLLISNYLIAPLLTKPVLLLDHELASMRSILEFATNVDFKLKVQEYPVNNLDSED